MDDDHLWLFFCYDLPYQPILIILSPREYWFLYLKPKFYHLLDRKPLTGSQNPTSKSRFARSLANKMN